MSPRRRIRFVSYQGATVETIRVVRELAGIAAIGKLDDGDWIEIDHDERAKTKLAALAERGVEFEFYEPPPPPPPPPSVEPPPRIDVPADFDMQASLRYDGGGGIRAARLIASAFDQFELETAIELTRTGGEIATGLPLSEAEAHAAAFAKIGVRVEVVPATAWTYAYLPNHDDGAGQALERMRIVGPELVVERGVLGSASRDWALVTRERHAGVAERDAAVAARHETWRAAGRQWTEDPTDLVAAVRSRDRALEMKIRAADDPSPLIAVYTDWLMDRGDPLGRLREAAAQGEKTFLAALAKHDVHLFWPLGRAREHARLSWANGLVDALTAKLPKQLDGFDSGMDFIDALLDLPCCSCLRELEIEGSAIAITSDFIVDALHGLRRLRIDGGLTGDVVVSDWSRLQRLETLELRAHHPKLAPFVLPNLRRLRIRYDRLGDEGVAMFEKAELGALERFEFVGEDRPERSDRIERILSSRALSTVKTAKIEVHGTRVHEAFVEAIVDSRLYRDAQVIELVAELDKDAEACAGRAAPTLRVDPGPFFPWQ